MEEWREPHRVAFRGINEFHEAARVDLGVQGKVSGERHPERDLLLPAARREGEVGTVKSWFWPVGEPSRGHPLARTASLDQTAGRL